MFENVIGMIKDAITAASAWLTAVFTSCGNEFFAIFISAFFIYTIYRLLLRPLVGMAVGASDRAVPSENKKADLSPADNAMLARSQMYKK